MVAYLMRNLLVLICAFCVFTGCASTKGDVPNLPGNDVYQDSLSTDTPLPSVVTFKSTIANVDPYEVGFLSFSMTNTFGFGQSETTMQVFFVPRTNDVELRFNLAGSKYSVTLDSRDRVLVLGSIKTYLEEFSARRLEREGDTVSNYGVVNLNMNWGLFTKNAIAEPKVKIGYTFVRQSPYYTLTYPETKNLEFEKNDSGSRIENSPFIRWFMTRSQAQAFGDILDQKFLESTLETQNIPKGDSNPDAY